MTTEPASTPAPATPPKPARRYLPLIVRILMGLIFLVFGLNGFLNFIPQPKTPLPQGAVDFSMAMMKTGYLFQMVAGTQVLVGALLLLNLFVPLALALIAPVIVNIIAFHLFLAPAPSMFAPGIVVAVMELYLAWAYRNAFCPMLAIKVGPS